MAKTPAQVAKLLAARIKAQVERGASKGTQAAAVFLVARIKETLSVPAPRKRVTSFAGVVYYKATTKATPGAPPRKVSGRLRSSITYAIISPKEAWVGTNVHYAKPLERKGHKFLGPTYDKYRTELNKIIGSGTRAEIRTGTQSPQH